MTDHHEHNHSACITQALSRVETCCQEKGLRLTETRRQVLEIIWQSHKALTAADIMAKLGNTQPPITYRALNFLTENGFIHPIASMNAFIGCPHPEKEHVGQLLVCTECHNVTELHDMPRAFVNAAQQQGFKIEHIQVELLGVCADCQKTA